MSKELDQALVSIINLTKDGVQAGVSFLNQQIPDVIQQLLIWKMAENIAWVIISFLVLCATYPVNKWILKKSKDNPYSPVEILLLWNIVPVIMIIIFFSTLFDLLQLYFAPKIFLIEYAAQLAK